MAAWRAAYLLADETSAAAYWFVAEVAGAAVGAYLPFG